MDSASVPFCVCLGLIVIQPWLHPRVAFLLSYYRMRAHGLRYPWASSLYQPALALITTIAVALASIHHAKTGF